MKHLDWQGQAAKGLAPTFVTKFATVTKCTNVENDHLKQQKHVPSMLDGGNPLVPGEQVPQEVPPHPEVKYNSCTHFSMYKTFPSLHGQRLNGIH